MTKPTKPKERESIAQSIERVKALLGDSWLPWIYRERILPVRTRAYYLPISAKENRVDVQHTLLGIEIKIGRRRLLTPDLATARYLAVCARAGCLAVALPYDITKISFLADQLESSWHRMLLLAEQAAAGRSQRFRSQLRSGLIAEVRSEIAKAGAGTSIPEFNQKTKQRGA
jgi:hypothetical protein